MTRGQQQALHRRSRSSAGSGGGPVTTAGSAAAAAPGSPAAVLATKRGLRMRPYRPMRALVGALLVVASVVIAIAIYTKVGDRTDYLALDRSVLAGEQISDDDLRVVSLSTDDDLNAVPASARATVIGQYARYRLRVGSLIGSEDVQATPLVTPGRALMSIAVVASDVPPGVREQSRVALVVSPRHSGGGDPPPPVRIDATVTAIPLNIAELRLAPDANRITATIAVEVAPEAMDLVAEAESITLAAIELEGPFPLGTVATASPADARDPADVAADGAPDGTALYGPTTIPPPAAAPAQQVTTTVAASAGAAEG